MNVRLHQGVVGQNFNFVPKQVISCSDEVGKRLIAGRIATKVSDSAAADDEYPELNADEKREAQDVAREKYKRMGLDPEKVFAKRRGIPERATRRTPETPETGKSPEPEKCTGTTSKGNPCGRASLPGTDRCKDHPKD